MEPRTIEVFAETVAEAVSGAVSRLIADRPAGTQALVWYGIDRSSGRPVCRITYVVES